MKPSGDVEYLPSETNTTAVPHAVAKNLAGQDGVAPEDDSKFLAEVSGLVVNRDTVVERTTSVKVLGRLEM